MGTYLYWTLVAVVLPLFLAQQVCWVALRLEKLTLGRWRRLTKTWFLIALGALAVGILTALLGSSMAEAAEVARLGITGGALNALVAGLHWRTVTLVQRLQRSRRP